MGDMMKVRFSEGEYGWAVRLSDDLAMIKNIPYGGVANLHDIVRYREKEDDFPTITEILGGGFSHSTAIDYDTHTQFHQLNAIFKMLGCSVEGVYGCTSEGAEPLEQGMLAVAHGAWVQPRLIAMGLGISQNLDEEELHDEVAAVMGSERGSDGEKEEEA